jgi:hypothetical protein
MGETGHRQPAGKAVTAKTRLTDRLNRRCNSYDVGGSKALTKADHREKRLPLHRTSFTPWLLGEDAPESRKKPPHNLRRYSSRATSLHPTRLRCSVKPQQKSGSMNMGTDGKTRPTSTQGVASPRANQIETKDRSSSTVSTRVGRNAVDIDIPALRNLVDTVKTKLKP